MPTRASAPPFRRLLGMLAVQRGMMQHIQNFYLYIAYQTRVTGKLSCSAAQLRLSSMQHPIDLDRFPAKLRYFTVKRPRLRNMQSFNFAY